MRWIAVAALVCGTRISAADDRPPHASEYASRSISVFAAGEVTPLPTSSGSLGLAGGVRVHRRHIAIEGRLGGAFSFSAVANAGLFVGRGGVSAGIALPIGSRLAVMPMLAYDLFVLDQPRGIDATLVQRVTVEVPVAILIYRHVAIEPFVQAGLAWVNGGRDIAFIAGPRISIVL